MIANGPVPGGLDVLHKCDNPPCCNPNHLFVGTHRENMLDKVAKGRHNAPRGERSAHARFTDEQVMSIRQRYADGEYQQALAEEFGVAQAHIQQITNGRLWSHLPLIPSSKHRRRSGWKYVIKRGAPC